MIEQAGIEVRKTYIRWLKKDEDSFRMMYTMANKENGQYILSSMVASYYKRKDKFNNLAVEKELENGDYQLIELNLVKKELRDILDQLIYGYWRDLNDQTTIRNLQSLLEFINHELEENNY